MKFNLEMHVLSALETQPQDTHALGSDLDKRCGVIQLLSLLTVLRANGRICYQFGSYRHELTTAGHAHLADLRQLQEVKTNA